MDTQEKSPFEICMGKKDNFTNFRTFGCHCWVRPPGQRKQKFKKFIRKGIFLGYTRQTQQNFIWFDVSTEKIKIASHGQFDEGFNDLPIKSIPPNVEHLTCSEMGRRWKKDCKGLNFDCDLHFYLQPFAELVSKTLKHTYSAPNLGMEFATAPLYKQLYFHIYKTSASMISSTILLCTNYNFHFFQ